MAGFSMMVKSTHVGGPDDLHYDKEEYERAKGFFFRLQPYKGRTGATLGVSEVLDTGTGFRTILFGPQTPGNRRFDHPIEGGRMTAKALLKVAKTAVANLVEAGMVETMPTDQEFEAALS